MPQDAVGQRLGVNEVVGRTDDAAVQIGGLGRLLVAESLRIVEKDHRAVMPQLVRLPVEDRDRLDDRQSAGRAGRGAGLVAQPQRLVQSGRGEDRLRLQFGAVFQHDAVRPSILDADLRHAAPQPQFAAQLAELAHQPLQDQPHAGQRPGQPFEEDRAEHDAELAEVHVMLPRPAVKQHRAKEHLHQQRIVDQSADDLPGGTAGLGPIELIVVGQGRQQPLKVVDLPGKTPRDLRLQQADVVGELQRRPGEHDRRANLRRQRQFVPRQAQLPQQPRQGALPRPPRRVVGHRVQADVERSSAAAVKRIQPADRAVALEDADAPLKVGQADAGRQSRHAGPDDDRVVHGDYFNASFISEDEGAGKNAIRAI